VTLQPARTQRLRCRLRPARRGFAALAALAELAALPLLAAPAASASPPRPADLRVVGGDHWHADDAFSLAWTAPPASNPPLAWTRYTVRDPQGSTIAAGQTHGIEDGIGALAVPRVPGIYSAEVWFEDTAGGQGPAAVTSLRFDDTRPAAVEPGPVPEWIGRTAFPLRVRIGHPPGAEPLAGIRGYAATIDANPSGVPCAASDRCTDAETALRGGIEDDRLEIAMLPEGTVYLHAVAVSGSGMKSAGSGHVALHVDLTDPVTRLVGASAGWANRPVSLFAQATDDASGMQPGPGAPAPFVAIRVDGGAPEIGIGGSAAARVIEEGVHRIEYYARDGAGNVDDGATVNGIGNAAPRTTLVRIDRTPPAVAFDNSQQPDEPDLLRAAVDDRLSGADPTRGWIGVRVAGSRDGFRRLPRPPGPRGELRGHWDSDSYPRGDYEFQATGYDLAGNATVTTRRRNGAPMILSNPLKATTALSARLGRGPKELTIPFGQGVHVAGRLTTGIRTPLEGMPVRIVERFAAGARPSVRVSTVETDSGGGYSLRLAPGPSREITASFPGGETLGRSLSAALSVAVRSAVRLRASSGVAEVGGPPLIFRGRVSPPQAIGEKGESVQLQFRLPGLDWSEFRTIQTDRRGRFRYAYRFSDDDSRGARFQFRAYVPAQDDWPYEPGGSRPVVVRGR
jgi:hypothetical protein